jgi:hypothetical protein
MRLEVSHRWWFESGALAISVCWGNLNTARPSALTSQLKKRGAISCAQTGNIRARVLSQRELKTWISEEAGPGASIEAVMSVAPYFRIDRQRAIQMLAQVEAAVSTWRSRGRELGMSASELDQFADAFEHREREVAQSSLRKAER